MKNITRSHTVEAVYADWTTAPSYGEPQAQILLEGAFAPEAFLAVQEWAPEPALVPAGFQVAAGCGFGGEQSESAPKGQTYTVHLRCEAAEAKVVLLQDGQLIEVPTQRDGSYLLFRWEGGGSVALLTKPDGSSQGSILGLCAAAAALALILVLTILRHKKKKKEPTKAA